MEELYIKQLVGFQGGTRQVCRLICGLKQVENIWKHDLHGTILDFACEVFIVLTICEMKKNFRLLLYGQMTWLVLRTPKKLMINLWRS